MTVEDRQSATSHVDGEPPARKPWVTPRVILGDAKSAGGGTSVTTIDFIGPITSFAS